MSIEVKGITKRYGSQLAVNHVSFSVQTGEVVGFIGPNGAGKSTTMKIITGTLPPDSGSVTINVQQASDDEGDDDDLLLFGLTAFACAIVMIPIILIFLVVALFAGALALALP